MSDHTQPSQTAHHAIKQSYLALRRGDRSDARRWAVLAASQNPQLEDPWLILASLGTPRASIHYLKQALKINPSSQRARIGMRWAIRRARKEQRLEKFSLLRRLVSPPHPVDLARRAWLPSTLVAALAVFIGLAAWFTFSYTSTAQAIGPSSLAAHSLQMPSSTPTLTQTLAPTPTPTPTFTPTPTATATPLPTATSTQPPPTQPPPPAYPGLPPGTGPNEHWIEIDLTTQQLFAYRGTEVVRSFYISAGKWNTPTVVGQFQIYNKIPSQTMFGADFYLPDVPYVMYFYSSYAIHGAYWHDNFGSPMSHGCINMRVSQAEWLYEFAPIGTWVVIHY